MAVNVLGLDLSITAPGLCADDNRACTLRTDDRRRDLRLNDIRDWVRYYARTRPRPVLAAIEDIVPKGNRSDTALILVQGAVRTELNDLGIPYVLVNQAWVKDFATGDSRADKAGMIRSAEATSGAHFADDNQADAWWLRRIGLVALDMVPASPRQREILGKVVGWPQPLILPWGPIPAGRRYLPKKCGHKILAMRVGDHWVHPFNFVVCEKPPA